MNCGLCDRQASTLAVVAEVTCIMGPWSCLGPCGALKYVEIFSRFVASGSVVQPPSSSPQEVHIHVIKQREAFRGLQAVGNKVC